MTTMSKRLTASDTMRSANEFAMSFGNGQAMTKAAETWFSATSECQREMMGFVSKRLEKDSATMREMLECRNIVEAAAVQSRWIEETLRDYNVEVTKLMAIFTKSVSGGAVPKG